MSSLPIRSNVAAGDSKSAGPVAPILETLRSGGLVDDRVFDDCYPFTIRRASHIHWTPVEAAVSAAKLLADKPGVRLLDIGSGVGKFCIVAAACIDAQVRGVEHRRHLVDIAARAAKRVGVEVTFTHGTLAPSDAKNVDAAYLFNPFAENLCSSHDQIDGTVELTEARFRRDIAIADAFFRAARVGMRVVTYCGFGGQLPEDYRLIVREHRAGRLELWVKTDGAPRRTRETPELGSATMSALRERAIAAAEESLDDP